MAAPAPYRGIAATHIRELASINQQLPDVLRKSATVTSLLTNRPVQQDEPIDTPAARAKIIEDTSYQLFLLVNKIRKELHEQVDQLQSEKVVPAELVRVIPSVKSEMSEKLHAALDTESTNDPELGVTNGGMGDMDIADLNARAGVRQQGDDEILGRIQGILHEIEQRSIIKGDGMAVDG